MNATKKALWATGEKLRLLNFLAKAGTGGQYGFLHDGPDAIVDTGLVVGGSNPFETTGEVGNWANFRVTGVGGSDPVAKIGGKKHSFLGLIVDAGAQSLRIAGPHHSLVGVRFHGNGVYTNHVASGHAFLRAAIEVDGSVDCQGLLVDDFELTPVGTLTLVLIGVCDTDGTVTLRNVKDVAGNVIADPNMAGLPICVRDGNGDGSDFVAEIQSADAAADTITIVGTPPSATKTATPFVIKGWKYVIDFLSGAYQVPNAVRAVLGDGVAHHCRSELWNPAGGRPGILGLIVQTGRASKVVGQGNFSGTGTTVTVNHSCINTPTLVLPISAGAAEPLAIPNANRLARTFGVVRPTGGQSGLVFRYSAEL